MYFLFLYRSVQVCKYMRDFGIVWCCAGVCTCWIVYIIILLWEYIFHYYMYETVQLILCVCMRAYIFIYFGTWLYVRFLLSSLYKNVLSLFFFFDFGFCTRVYYILISGIVQTCTLFLLLYESVHLFWVLYVYEGVHLFLFLYESVLFYFWFSELYECVHWFFVVLYVRGGLVRRS